MQSQGARDSLGVCGLAQQLGVARGSVLLIRARSGRSWHLPVFAASAGGLGYLERVQFASPGGHPAIRPGTPPPPPPPRSPHRLSQFQRRRHRYVDTCN
jgi:hypothetical protein